MKILKRSFRKTWFLQYCLVCGMISCILFSCFGNSILICTAEEVETEAGFDDEIDIKLKINEDGSQTTRLKIPDSNDEIASVKIGDEEQPCYKNYYILWDISVTEDSFETAKENIVKLLESINFTKRSCKVCLIGKGEEDERKPFDFEIPMECETVYSRNYGINYLIQSIENIQKTDAEINDTDDWKKALEAVTEDSKNNKGLCAFIFISSAQSEENIENLASYEDVFDKENYLHQCCSFDSDTNETDIGEWDKFIKEIENTYVVTFDKYRFDDELSKVQFMDAYGNELEVITKEMNAKYADKDEKNSPSLISLKIVGQELSPEFSPLEKNYTTTISGDVTSMTITATATDAEIKVHTTNSNIAVDDSNKPDYTLSMDEKLKDGDTFDINIVVTSENGENEEYTISVAVEDGKTWFGLPGNWIWYLIGFILFVVILILIIITCVVRRKRKKAREKKKEQKKRQKKKQESRVLQNNAKLLSLSVLGKNGYVISKLVDGSVIVGRSDLCEIFINEPSISRQHFAIEYDGENFYIQNLSRTNGTKLNGILLDTKRVLQPEDKITIGSVDMIVRW